MNIGKEDEPIQVPAPETPDYIPEEFPDKAPANPDPQTEPVPVGPSED